MQSSKKDSIRQPVITTLPPYSPVPVTPEPPAAGRARRRRSRVRAARRWLRRATGRRPPIRIGAPVRSSNDGCEELSAVIHVGDTAHEVRFRTPDAPIDPSVDPFVILGLTPAMRLGAALEVLAPVSPDLTAMLPRIQREYLAQDERLTPAKFATDLARSSAAPDPEKMRVGLFFSGGVDSFYTLLTRRDEIDALIFVHGFDIPLANFELGEQTLTMCQEVAKAFGKDLVRVETDMRNFSNRYVDWGKHQCGPGLAAVAMLLGARFSEVLVSAEYIYNTPGPVPGGLPRPLDDAWRNGHVKLTPFGRDKRRVEKISEIAGDPVVCRSLRVCWRNPDNVYNCGRCSKCIRNMAMLEALGALDQVTTFPAASDPEAARTLAAEATVVDEIDQIREVLRIAEHNNTEGPLIAALRSGLPD